MRIKKNWIKDAIRICVITAMAALLSKTVMVSFTSLPAFRSMVEVKDYRMSDLYNRVSNSRTVRELSKKVVLVAVDGLSREGIAKTIEVISTANPAAVGVDILFEYPYDGDSLLVNSIVGSKAVMAAYETGDGDVVTSYFCDTSTAIGIVNLIAADRASVVRNYRMDYLYGYAFAAELVKVAYPSQYKCLLDGKGENMIYFPLMDFLTIPADSVLVGGCLDVLAGKMVLIGDNHNMADMHVTPIGTMSGLQVQASIVETIVSKRHIHSCSSFCNWLIAVLSCMVFVALNVFFAKKMPVVGKLIMRVVQLLTLYLYFLAGCWMFSRWRICIDFSLALAMIALGLLAYDIWFGVEKLVSVIITYFKHKKS